MAKVDLQTLWDKVVEQVKQKVIHPTLWRTIEMAVPVTVEGTTLILGFGPGTFHLSGHLTTSEHRNAIEASLKQLTGVPLTIRIIDGTTMQDWVAVKQKDASMQALKDAAYAKREANSAVTKSWEGLLEQVGRRYASLPLRQLPQFRAKYIEEMIQMIVETMDELMPPGRMVDELSERSLARIIDRVGTLAEVPPALVALELKKSRERNN